METQHSPLKTEDTTNYSIRKQGGREGVKEYFSQIEPIIIATIKSVYGVETLSEEFLSDLAFRAFLRGAFGNIFWLPGSMNPQQKEFAAKLAEITSVKIDQIRFESVQALLKNFDPQDRKRLQPYMRTPLIYGQDPNFREQVVKQPGFVELINSIRELGDKVGLINFLNDQGFSELIPPNTEIVDEGDSGQRRERLISLAKSRYGQCKKGESHGFVIKAGEGASGENMIIVKCENTEITINGKSIKDIEDLTKAIKESIPEENRYIKGNLNGDKRDPNEKLPQRFLIQDLIPLTAEQYPNENYRKESSINFFIDPENGNIHLIATTANIARGGVHQGNIEMVLPTKVTQKLTALACRFKDYGYRGPLGFDFAWKRDGNGGIKIVLFEANTRFTAPWSGAMLAHKFHSKFEKYPSFALNQHCQNCNKSLEEINGTTSIVPFSPPNDTEQGIVVLGPNPGHTLEEIINETANGITTALTR